MSPKGGKRPGAGRKPIRGERKRQFGIWLPPSLSAWLDALVARTGRSRSELIAEALEALRAGPAPVPQAEPSVPARDARDAEAYRALLEALAAAEVPAGPLAAFNLPQALARQVSEAIAPGGKPSPVELREALARFIALGLVAERALQDAAQGQEPQE